jgi:adenosyl cobinamide kinase/adenosyl cobinamide phosphate guanylyltransferase
MSVTMPLTFVTGPVRSGKSRFAVSCAAKNPGVVKYVATAKRDEADAEWQARLEHHRASRPRDWETFETAGWDDARLAEFLAAAAPVEVLIVDSLGGWLDAHISQNTDRMKNDYAAFQKELDASARAFGDALIACEAQVIAVGEEVGWGIVPLAPSARLFRDVLGRMQQRLAASAREAFLVVSGFAVDLRAVGRPFP